MNRVVIIGGPRTGKTTLADTYTSQGYAIYHTDDLMNLEWSEASEEGSTWFDRPGKYVIEGTMAVRALRKWIDKHPTGKPCDLIIFISSPKEKTTKGQDSMAKGVIKIMNDIIGELLKRQVEIQYN